MSKYDKNYYLKNRKIIIGNQLKYYYSNLERKKRENREYQKRIRQEALDIYGNQCACCGEREYKFLTFDHINGDGNKHRKENNNIRIENWLRKNNYPKGIQILCWNCNSSKGAYGKCPHQEN